ncbi:MAG: SDR family oxidoreductase [Planctomycetota bacterium]
MAPTNLHGKVAVITGASRGLGLGLARELAAAGLVLGLCARTRPVLPPHARGIAERVDVGDHRQVSAFARLVHEQLGAIDLWINNAGVLDPIQPVRDVDADAFAQLVRVNLLGVMHGTQAYLRSLRERSAAGGVLINISSGAAARAYAGWSAYCASKAAVERFTECVQLEEGSAGVRAYAVAPGIIDTAMQAKIRATSAQDFPAVPRFLAIKQQDAFNTVPFVARQLLEIAFDPSARPEQVVVRLPNEKPLPP